MVARKVKNPPSGRLSMEHGAGQGERLGRWTVNGKGESKYSQGKGVSDQIWLTKGREQAKTGLRSHAFLLFILLWCWIPKLEPILARQVFYHWATYLVPIFFDIFLLQISVPPELVWDTFSSNVSNTTASVGRTAASQARANTKLLPEMSAIVWH